MYRSLKSIFFHRAITIYSGLGKRFSEFDALILSFLILSFLTSPTLAALEKDRITVIDLEEKDVKYLQSEVGPPYYSRTVKSVNYSRDGATTIGYLGAFQGDLLVGIARYESTQERSSGDAHGLSDMPHAEVGKLRSFDITLTTTLIGMKDSVGATAIIEALVIKSLTLNPVMDQETYGRTKVGGSRVCVQEMLNQKNAVQVAINNLHHKYKYELTDSSRVYYLDKPRSLVTQYSSSDTKCGQHLAKRLKKGNVN